MTIWTYNPNRDRYRTVLGLTILIFLISFNPAAAIEAQPPAGNEPISIKADKLIIDSAINKAVFSGNARAVQADTVLTADHLTIFSTQSKDSPSGLDFQNIERIEADGHVKIEFDNRVATTEKAIYHSTEKKLVLIGPGTKVTSGQDEVIGRIITFFRESGRIEIVGDETGQVKATIHATERGLN